jgi:hypothetical protein
MYIGEGLQGTSCGYLGIGEGLQALVPGQVRVYRIEGEGLQD